MAPPAARSTNQVIQREVDKNTQPGVAVIVTNPKYKMKYRTSGKVVRQSRQAGHLVIEFDGMQTPNGADGFRLHASDLDYAPTTHKKISVTPYGNQTFILVGTMHGLDKKLDISGNLNPELLTNSTLILEYPPLENNGQKPVVADPTQNTLATLASSNPQKGIVVVGADARKAYDDNGLHEISIRHKTDDKFKISQDRMPRDAVEQEGAAFINYCLKLNNGAAPALGAFISRYVEYTDGTKLQVVIGKAMVSVRAKADTMEESARTKVAQVVLRQLKDALDEGEDEFTYLKDCKNENDRVGIIRRGNQELVSALNDSICNLLLLTEALTAKTRKVVVAFGAEHTKLLAELFES